MLDPYDDFTLFHRVYRRVLRVFWAQLLIVAVCGVLLGYGIGKI